MKKLGMATIVKLLGGIGLAAVVIGYFYSKKKGTDDGTAMSDTDNEETEAETEVTDE